MPPPLATISSSPTPETRLDLHLFVERNSKFVRGKSRAHKGIEQFCLDEYRMHCVEKHRTRYGIVMPFAPGPELESAIEDLLAEMHHIADLCHCWIEASLRNPVTDTYWS